jgi:hypothetical protein
MSWSMWMVLICAAVPPGNCSRISIVAARYSNRKSSSAYLHCANLTVGP